MDNANQRSLLTQFVNTGGGAIDMEISKHLREYAKQVAGKEQLLVAAVARAFEAIPRQLCDNAGFDATNILNKLRNKHHNGSYHDGPFNRSGPIVALLPSHSRTT